MSAAKTESTAGWEKWAAVFVLLAVLSLAAALYLIDYASPETANLFDKRWEGSIRTVWNLGQVRTALGLLVASVACSAAGLLARMLHGPAPGDAKAPILAFFGLAALAVIAWLIFAGPLS